MILQALNSYYERLDADPETEIAEFGFSRQRISYAVVLKKDGTFESIEDLRQQDGKKLLAQSLVVCGGAKPSGSGINPCFLWDNPTYMLGYKPDDPKPKRTLESFEAFKQRHLDLEAAIDDPEFSAVCRFLENWETSQGAEQETLVEIATGFGIFRISGKKHFVHEVPAIRDWWIKQLESDDDNSDGAKGQCLVTGQPAAIARLHEPKIKGVVGGQSAGAAIVSFNLDAFESYGKSQSNNSPVSEQVAFQYCTALNRLLADRRRRIQIGDATTVFWTEQKAEAENILGIVLGNPAPEDEVQVEALNATLKTIASGRYPGNFGDPETPFYMLGLSPNAARISVRFWNVSTLGDLVEKLKRHYEDLAIIGFESDSKYPAIWELLRQTARESKDISPQLSGMLMRSMLTGTAYPESFYSAVLRRIRADREVWYLRVASIKAVINRKIRLSNLKRPFISEGLDEDRVESMYHIGRLFRQLENLQVAAYEGLENTIRHRYLASGMQTPAVIFPQLLALYHHHIRKLPQEDKKAPWKTQPTFESRINSIMNQISEFPLHADSLNQGLFVIGYHHERNRHVKLTSLSEKEASDA